jgi:putative DNA primase/helicase
MTLSPDHLQQLTDGSGIAREVIDERGYRTCTGYSELKSLAIPLRRDTDTHGLLIPLYTTEGKGAQTYIAKEDRSVPLMVYRPDTPEIDAEGRERKYLYPGGQRTRLDCHPRCFPMLSDPTKPLWITEGQKKGDSLVTRGQCSLALLGVWNWRGRNDKGGTMALPDWQSVALNNRDIRIVFDSDVVEKPQVRQALEALAQFLSAKQATVHVAYLPSADGAKVGVDDFLLTHTIADLERLLEAPRQAAKAPKSLSTLKHAKNGEPRPILFNLMEVLLHDAQWQGVLRYNAFSGVVEIHAPPPCFVLDIAWKTCPLEEHHVSEIARWFQDAYNICTPTSLVFEALVTIAHRDTYNPVRDYLTGLVWDGTKRLDTWLTTYCHVEDSPYTQAVGAKTLISGVARIVSPGCKVDTMTILIGEQGYMKSTVWEILATPAWFADNLADFHTKDALLDLRSKWIVEFADLSNFGRSEIETIKRFVSARQDHYRAPYERHSSTVPRAVLFVGTTNKETFLKDETGNRRFWPVKVQERCDLASLARDRDQLWAEALQRYQAGEIWYLTGDVLAQAEEEQAARVEVDAWMAPIVAYLNGNLLRRVRFKGKLVPSTTTNELLEFALGLDKLHWTSGNSRRVAAILRLLKWRYERVENPDSPSSARQIKVFIRETDETDNAASKNPSVSASPPLKTYVETDETDETDSIAMYGADDGEAKSYHASTFIQKLGQASVSLVSSVSNGAMPVIPIDCAETDTRKDAASIGLTPSQHRSQAPLPGQGTPGVGDWVWFFSGDGVQQNVEPYLITAIEADSNGQRYAQFLETGKYWPLAQCERTDPPEAAVLLPPRGEAPAATTQSGRPCFACHGTAYWRNALGMAICARCHPPAAQPTT